MKTAKALSNKELTSAMFDAFKKGDIPFIVDHLSDDCSWNTMGAPYIPFAGSYRGKETYEFFKRMDQEIEILNFEVKNIFEVSKNEVISLGFMESKSRKTGKTASSPWAMYTKTKDGKVTYFQDYVDTARQVAALS